MATRRAEAKYTVSVKDKAKSAFRSIKRGLKSVAKAILSFKGAIIGAVGIGGLGLLVKRSLDATDRLGKMSKALGLSVENLQQYRAAAEEAGINTSQFDSNMTAFVKRVGEAKEGVGPLVSFLKKYDEQLLENIKNARSQAEALDLIADATQKAGSAAEQAAIQNAAFSRAGVTMVNMTKDGAEGLKELREQFDTLGITLSRTAVQGVEDANDEITRLMTLFAGFRDQTVAALAPALEEAVTMFKAFMLEVAEGKGGVREFSKDIAETILNGFEAITIGIVEMGNTVQETIAFFRAGELRGLQQQLEETEGAIAKLIERGSKEPIFVKALKTGRETAEKLREEIESLTPAIVGTGGITETFEKLRAALDNTGEAGEESGGKIEGAYRNASDPVRTLYKNIKQIKPEMVAANGAARDLGRTFSSAFEDAVIGGEDLRSVLRGLVQDIQQIILRRTISEPLGNLVSSLIPSFSFGGGGAPNMGAQSVAATFAGAFAGGGNFTVGGTGGTDSQLIAFRATPGEQVAVRTPAQQAGGGDVTVNISVAAGGAATAEDPGKAGEFGRLLGNLVATEIQRQKRPGGLLA